MQWKYVVVVVAVVSVVFGRCTCSFGDDLQCQRVLFEPGFAIVQGLVCVGFWCQWC